MEEVGHLGMLEGIRTLSPSEVNLVVINLLKDAPDHQFISLPHLRLADRFESIWLPMRTLFTRIIAGCVTSKLDIISRMIDRYQPSLLPKMPLEHAYLYDLSMEWGCVVVPSSPRSIATWVSELHQQNDFSR
jgi:hypothetical protein